MGKLGKMLVAAAAVATPASAVDAACWSEAAYKAAQVRELDTMMMVEALRCRKTAANFVHDYNRYVVASRPALLKANADLRTHFAGAVGQKSALNAYDNYMTTVANRYGAGTEGLECADMASIVQAAVATNGSADALYAIAVAANMVPTVASDRCEPGPAGAVTVAARR
jgi:hypothetical protein